MFCNYANYLLLRLHIMKIRILSLGLMSIFLFTGCFLKEVEVVEQPKTKIVHTYSMDETIVELGNVLANNFMKNEYDNGKIAITTFVELNDFSKTSKFGRVLSESLINELSFKNLNLLDFRAKRTISINNEGEFFLSRDAKFLRKSMNSKYILVGTYSKNIDKGLLINARIINSKTGVVVSTASIIYHNYDCRLFESCKKSNSLIKLTSTKLSK